MLEKEFIIDALQKLNQRDKKRELFGSQGHDYILHPPIRKAEVIHFETTYSVKLPEDYTIFVTEIGNGGAGPYYGVFKFGEQDDGYDFCPWEEGYLLGDVSTPFPHEKTWNLPPSFWEGTPDPPEGLSDEEEDTLWEEWDKELEEHYWNPNIMNGAIPICHLGCAYRHWLVIHGRQKGFVWADVRVDYKGIYPLLDTNGCHMTFETWYMSWLEEALHQFGIA